MTGQSYRDATLPPPAESLLQAIVSRWRTRPSELLERDAHHPASSFTRGRLVVVRYGVRPVQRSARASEHRSGPAFRRELDRESDARVDARVVHRSVASWEAAPVPVQENKQAWVLLGLSAMAIIDSTCENCATFLRSFQWVATALVPTLPVGGRIRSGRIRQSWRTGHVRRTFSDQRPP
jgi:hypothetical protein